jgi:hypothetical protein
MALEKICGVDLTSDYGKDQGKGNETFWIRWGRIAIGLRPSPYCVVQMMVWLDETVFGDHLDPTNVFR